MKRLLMTATVALMTAAGWSAPAETSLPAVGDPAPGFSLLGSDGRAHGLAGHRGRQAVVLAFYPKAFTGG